MLESRNQLNYAMNETALNDYSSNCSDESGIESHLSLEF